jgi:hypothetical protein
MEKELTGDIGDLVPWIDVHHIITGTVYLGEEK